MEQATTLRGEYPVRLIGSKSLIPLYFPEVNCRIWCKCEFLNPDGSIKDRLARTIIMDAERNGLLNEHSIILECTSGDTGISFAMLGAARGY
jgi:cysteine synthase A